MLRDVTSLAPIGALLVGCATLSGATDPLPERRCPGGFDASFIQLGERELELGEAEWADEIELLRSAGVELAIVQFSGDERGSYDRRRPGREPIRALLAAATAARLPLFLGLWADPGWPRGGAVEGRLPPPLDRPEEARALGELCRASPACVGWYIPEEIDDATFSGPGRADALRAYLVRAAAALHMLAPHRRVAIAPFFSGRGDAAEHAAFWGSVLRERSVDIVMLQDGVGAGRATPAMAARYLAAMQPVAGNAGVELWSVLELFLQTHGPPIDERAFAAEPMHPATLWASLAAERGVARRMVAFSVLDYMDPRRGDAARRLYRNYTARCAPRARP